MTTPDLQRALTDYGAGLEAELSLLRQLHRLAARQKELSARQDLTSVAGVSEERQRLMNALLSTEAEIRPLRELLAANRTQAARFPGFAEIAARHRLAADLVTTILGSDQATLSALEEAVTVRRVAAQIIESGEDTLAAYRRVLMPASSAAALVDQRG